MEIEIKSRETLMAEMLAGSGLPEAKIEEIVDGINRRIESDALVAYTASEIRRALIAARSKAAEAAKPLGDGIANFLPVLMARMWTGRLFENLKAMLQKDERIEAVDWFVIATNQRRISRDEAKAAGRKAVEINDAMYARNFDSDQVIRAREAAEAEQQRPSLGPSGIQMDYPGGVRPGR